MRAAISIGDINGVGIEIALKAHKSISEFCEPIYMIDKELLQKASNLLSVDIPRDFKIGGDFSKSFTISPSLPTKDSGLFSYQSFINATNLVKDNRADFLTTLPINKEAWKMAGIKYIGHTDALKSIFKSDPIMMIGCSELFCALFTHHIPLRDVPKKIEKEPLREFLLTLYKSIKERKIAVLGLNPHAGDNGVIGDEESIIKEAIKESNEILKKEIFFGPLVPDTAFTKGSLENFSYFVALYHDQGLIAVKSLFFEESINVSLNLPIIRTSVDHGTAYDIAYKGKNPSTLSYINAIREGVRLSKIKR
jgi:4-hydroxythreonine-4-phosphate dehydrogenase